MFVVACILIYVYKLHWGWYIAAALGAWSRLAIDELRVRHWLRQLSKP